MENPIAQTSFESDICNDKHQIHREMLISILSQKFECHADQVVFTKPPTNQFDDVVKVLDKPECPLEYKIDFRAFTTGNVVFETAPVVPVDMCPEVLKTGSPKMTVGSNRHKEAIDVVKNINRNLATYGKPSRHLVSNDNYYFCYAISKTNSDNTISAKDLALYVIFRSKRLAEFVKQSFEHMPAIITKSIGESTNRQWYTISMLVPIDWACRIGSAYNINGSLRS